MRARWLPWLILSAACGSASPGVGRERGACRTDGTCDPGLQCLSRVCVEVVGERCQQVGQRAAALVTEATRRRPLLAAALGEMPARIADLLTAACNQDGWSRAAQRCVLDARDHDRLEACLADLPPGPRAALARREAELAAGGDRVEHDLPDQGGGPDRIDPVDPVDPVDPSGPPLALTGDQLGPQCEAYVTLLGRYARCPAMPPQARTSLLESTRTVRRSFAQVPIGSRHLMENGCGQAVKALTDALATLGCP